MRIIHKNLKVILFLFALLSYSLISYAQVKTITGKVTDANTGEPLPGVTVVVKNTTIGTVTNFDGDFNIEVETGQTLAFSFIGYAPQEFVVGTSHTLNVKLAQSVENLDEVVVIGYGQVKKSDATGSVAVLKPDEQNKGLTLNAQDMIAGKIAGVNITSGGGTPGGSSTIRIRGGSSLSAGNDPLIVVDGLAMDNDGIKGVSNFLSTVNPNDIESVSVLKDASATAIYGSRASNGVIIITTKKGKLGTGPRVSYNGSISLSAKKETLDVLSADEFRDYVTKLYADEPDVIANLGDYNTDWQDLVYRHAISHDHNISVTGGFKNIPYRVSFGYTNQDGIIKTSNFERYTGSVNLSPSLFDNHLKLNLNAKGMIVNNRFADGGVIGGSAAMDPTQPVKSSDAAYETFGGYWQWYTVDATIGITDNSLATNNPVALLKQKDDSSHAKDFIGNAEIDYKLHFFPDIHLHMNLGADISDGKQDTYITKESATNHPHGYSKWDKQYKKNLSFNSYVQYLKEFSIHKIDVIAGYEWQHFYRDGSYFAKGLDGYEYQEKVIDWARENYLVSFFGRLNYTLANKYLLTGTVRYDGSSRFSDDNRWGLFPSFAFAWKVKDENFLKNVDAISDLKLRLGYGVTGQQNLNLDSDVPYLATYTASKDGGYYPFGSTYYSTYLPDAYNADLKWEETTTYNAGINFGFFGNRLTGSVDYYFRETKDLLNEIDIPAGTNFKPSVISNIGSLENQGFEFEVTGRIISTEKLQWEASYNISFNRNEITKLTNVSDEGFVATGGISAGTGNKIQAHAVNFPASSFYVYEQVYDTDGSPIEGLFVDRNGDNIINDDDRYFYKKPTPDVTMGFSTKVIYKGFDLGFTARASIGNYMYNDVAASGANVGESGVWSTSGFFSNKLKSAVNDGFIGKTNYYLSDYYVENASFLKIDNITLGYSFDDILTGRIYITVQNPFVFTDYSGLDPEVFGGIDNNIYPRPVISILGLTLNF